MAPAPDFSSIEEVEALGFASMQENVSSAFRERTGARVERVAGVVTILAPKAEMAALNRVWLPGEAPPVTVATLETIRAYARNVGSRKMVAHCPTWAASPEMMSEHGFELRPSMFKFARRTSLDPPPESLRIEQLKANDAIQFGQVAVASNETEDWMSDGFNSTVGLPGWIHYLAFDSDTPIAVAAMFSRDRYAWCCIAATIPGYRGRGAQLALLTRRVRDAARLGIEWIVAEARVDNPGSARNMLRAGFEVVYERPNYTADLTV